MSDIQDMKNFGRCVKDQNSIYSNEHKCGHRLILAAEDIEQLQSQLTIATEALEYFQRYGSILLSTNVDNEREIGRAIYDQASNTLIELSKIKGGDAG